jgi:peptidoglycan-associated lipoprotein
MIRENTFQAKAAIRLPFCCYGSCMALLLVMLLLFSQEAVGQTQAQIEMNNAYQAFLEKRYFSAALLYKRSYDKIRDQELKDSAAFMIAESYRLANNLKLAFKWFETTVNTRYPNPEILFLYGQALKNYERYDEAAKLFYDYNFEQPESRSKGEREIRACELSKKWKEAPSRYEIRNIGALNSESSDYCPYISGNMLYFSSARATATGSEIFEWTGQKCSDIFQSELGSAGSWSKPEIVPGPVNSPFNEGASCMDAAGTTLYYTQCNGTDGKGITCNIYVSQKSGDTWSEGELLPFCSEQYSTGHPSLSADGKKLFFSSDMQGGFGAHDIYEVDKDPATRKWKDFRNLGPLINTEEDEMFPAISQTGVLYFSSKGHMGMGGFDIFFTSQQDGKWTAPENMKYPVNSGGDDFNLVFTPGYAQFEAGKSIAYLASNRVTGEGDDDIYELRVKSALHQLQLTVKDKETGKVLPGTRILTGPVNREFTADSAGQLKTELKNREGNRTTVKTTVDASHEGYYLAHYEIADVSGTLNDTTIYLEVLLSPIPAMEKEIVLEGILYDLDKFALREESKKVLDSLIIILKQNPGVAVEIASHTDSRSDSAYNFTLSQKRAQTCVDYLIGRGISKDRLAAVGYGESRPVNNCTDGVPCTEEQHQQNRRTSFRIISTNYRGK